VNALEQLTVYEVRATNSFAMHFAKVLLSVVGVAVGVIYILNPTAGVFEILSDNLPLVGNLDEAAATALVIASARHFMSLRAATKTKTEENT